MYYDLDRSPDQGVPLLIVVYVYAQHHLRDKEGRKEGGMFRDIIKSPFYFAAGAPRPKPCGTPTWRYKKKQRLVTSSALSTVSRSSVRAQREHAYDNVGCARAVRTYVRTRLHASKNSEINSHYARWPLIHRPKTGQERLPKILINSTNLASTRPPILAQTTF